jgi:RNA recognition motif-containing protein
MFGFVGFRKEQDATNAMKFYNRTYIDTSRISIDVAKSVSERLRLPGSAALVSLTDVRCSSAERRC